MKMVLSPDVPTEVPTDSIPKVPSHLRCPQLSQHTLLPKPALECLLGPAKKTSPLESPARPLGWVAPPSGQPLTYSGCQTVVSPWEPLESKAGV